MADHQLPDLPEFLNAKAEEAVPLREAVRSVLVDGPLIDECRENGKPYADAHADKIMELLHARGHVLPGCPAAAQILKDAQQFAGQYTLAVLCIRLLRMLNTRIVTPETKGTEKWLNDYLDGRNHGPVGKPMLWPGGLVGLSDQLRQWGYQPTPTKPAFVARISGNAIIPEQASN